MSVYQQGGGRNSRSSSSTKVFLNVYDLMDNDYLYPWGFGAYHSGVQVGSREYTFAGGSGVYSMEPKTAPGARFRETVELGSYTGSSTKLERVLDQLRQEFTGDDYNVLSRNCNTFADSMSRKLLGRPIPGYVNRMATLGSYFSCCLPPDMVPPPAGEDSNGGGLGGRRPSLTNGSSSSTPASGGGGRRVPSGFSSMSTSSAAPTSSSSVFASGKGRKLGGGGGASNRS